MKMITPKEISRKIIPKEHSKTRSCSQNLELSNKLLVEDGLICSSCGFTTAESKTFKRRIDGVPIIGLTNCAKFGYNSIKADTFSGMYILPLGVMNIFP